VYLRTSARIKDSAHGGLKGGRESFKKTITAFTIKPTMRRPKEGMWTPGFKRVWTTVAGRIEDGRRGGGSGEIIRVNLPGVVKTHGKYGAKADSTYDIQ